MKRFTIIDTPLAGLKVVERQRIGDERGFLSRLFCAKELAIAGWGASVAQINHTLTELKGTVRGMHFQYSPHAEKKLVACIKGTIWDVAVDLREGSPTFLQWFGQELSATNLRAMMIPEGFAHGFQTLDDYCELIYLHSHHYVPEAEAGLNPRDPKLSISWPLNITVMSQKDSGHPLLNQTFSGLTL